MNTNKRITVKNNVVLFLLYPLTAQMLERVESLPLEQQTRVDSESGQTND